MYHCWESGLSTENSLELFLRISYMNVSGVISRFTLMYLISEYFLILKIYMFALGRLFSLNMR